MYNYTYHFPYIWEELVLPISYRDDRRLAEQILLEAAERHGVTAEKLSREQIDELEHRYRLPIGDIAPRVYMRLTDNWVELAVRFLVPDHGVRDIKDKMSREVIARLDEAKIGIASATYEITGLPTLRIEQGRLPHG